MCVSSLLFVNDLRSVSAISCPTTCRNSPQACLCHPCWMRGAEPTAVCSHTQALVSRSVLEAVSRSVVSRAGIWAGGIPQNCVYKVLCLFKSCAIAPWLKGLACAVTQLRRSTTAVFSFLNTTAASKGESRYVNLQHAEYFLFSSFQG